MARDGMIHDIRNSKFETRKSKLEIRNSQKMPLRPSGVEFRFSNFDFPFAGSTIINRQWLLPTLASASVKARGAGGITGTKVTVFFTSSAVRCTFNRSNRKVNFFSRSCPMRARISAGKSQNLRLKGPKAFFRVLYKNCSSVSEALRSSAQSLRSVL